MPTPTLAEAMQEIERLQAAVRKAENHAYAVEAWAKAIDDYDKRMVRQLAVAEACLQWYADPANGGPDRAQATLKELHRLGPGSDYKADP